MATASAAPLTHRMTTAPSGAPAPSAARAGGTYAAPMIETRYQIPDSYIPAASHR